MVDDSDEMNSDDEAMWALELEQKYANLGDKLKHKKKETGFINVWEAKKKALKEKEEKRLWEWDWRLKEKEWKKAGKGKLQAFDEIDRNVGAGKID